jgi:prepilin-type N-terminal cleavage/methylation domain-containing protein
MSRFQQIRKGFTLVELLVVMGMLAGFMALILAGMRPTGSSQARQFAQLMSASLLTAQSKALASPTGSAIVLAAGENGMPAVACNSIYRADVAPFIVGTCTSGVPPASLSGTTTAAVLSPTNTDAVAFDSGYKIRFYSDLANGSAPSVWFAFNPTNTEVSFNAAINQTIDNTVWPTPYPGKLLDFEMARYPARSGLDFVPTAQAGIDLRYSGIGDLPNAAYGTLSAEAPSITLLFNRQGGLEAIDGSVTTPTSPTAPLYLLVASVADIADNASLQSENSRWVTIAPSTGRVTVSPNVPNANVFDARAFARQGATGGGP